MVDRAVVAYEPFFDVAGGFSGIRGWRSGNSTPVEELVDGWRFQFRTNSSPIGYVKKAGAAAFLSRTQGLPWSTEMELGY